MKALIRLTMSGVLAATLPFGQVVADDMATDFALAQEMCAADRCALFSTISPLPQGDVSVLAERSPKTYMTSGDGINLVDVALGGMAGAIIGDEIGGTSEAAAFGLLGVGLALAGVNSKADEEEGRRRDEAWRRGTDTYYNPAHPFPATAHWLGGRGKKGD